MSYFEKAYTNELEYFIECFLDDEFEDEEDKKVIKELTDEDKRDIVDSVLNDSELNSVLNSTIRYYIFHRKGV